MELSPSLRISYGNEAEFNQFPSTVSIQIVKKAKLPSNETTVLSSHTCGGALIWANLVLTAAHCALTVPAGVLIGGTIVPTYRGGNATVYSNTTNAPEYYGISGYVLNPLYASESRKNDLAILFLDSTADAPPVNFLPPKAAQLQQNQVLTVAGWGSIENRTDPGILKFAYLTVSNHSIFEDCPDYPGILCLANTPIQTINTTTNEPVTAYQGTCTGDSGSPVYLKDTNTQVAITSFGPPSCGFAPYAGYVNVSFYYNSFILPTLITYGFPDPPPKASCPTPLKVNIRDNTVYRFNVDNPSSVVALSRRNISSVYSPEICGQVCSMDPKCYTFNYNKVRKSCYLNIPEIRGKLPGMFVEVTEDTGFASGFLECAATMPKTLFNGTVASAG